MDITQSKMKLKLVRKYRKETYTIGKLYVDGTYFCDTIEDKDRGLDDSMCLAEIMSKKRYGETAIPYGTYKVEITYSPKYKKMMPLIMDVKGFSGIRIHSGNTAKDTLGCLIIGRNTQVGMVTESRKTYNKLFALMKDAKDISIEITK
jgi:hypothetical protein